MEHGYKGEQDRNKLEWKLDSLKEAKEDIELQFTNFSSETLPYLILLDEMSEVEEQLESEYRLSSQVMSCRENLEKKQHINKVLGNDTASPLLEDQKNYCQELTKVGKSYSPLKIISLLYIILKQFQIKSSKASLKGSKKNARYTRNSHGCQAGFSKYDEILDEVKQLEYQITNLPTSEQTDKQDKECKRLDSEIDTINNMLKEIEDKVLIIDEKLSKCEQELQELRFQIRRNREIKTRLEIGELVLSLYGEFISQLKLEKAKAIEQRAEGMFHKLTHKDANKFKFSIDEGTFALSLLRADGTPRPKRLLSEAEKQIYGLSITFALGTSSIREFGFMIDSPFGKLDKNIEKM